MNGCNTVIREVEQLMKLTVNTQQKKEALGDLFGIFFEDINHAADGGLYAEMVQNRSFEFDTIDNPDYYPMYAWEIISDGNSDIHALIDDKKPICACNKHYLVLDVKSTNERAGIRNKGYNSGMYFQAGDSYLLTVFVKSLDSRPHTLYIALEDETAQQCFGTADISVSSPDWEEVKLGIKADATTVNGRLSLTMKESGKIALGYISLFPQKTFRGRENGVREDLGRLLADLKPKFMRFPGGCLVHDGSMNAEDRDSLYRWKNTIGPVAYRPAKRNNWGYHQTLGLGYYEYFLLAEDIGAKPLPVLPAGWNPHRQCAVPLEEIQEWVQEALDLIEFANGDTATKWGAVRAQLGHPAPFGLEYIAIGNEEVGEAFYERYPYFHKAIKEKYPDMKIINSAGPFAAGHEYDKGWESAAKWGSDLIDEHYYMTPEWFIANHHRYDSFCGKGTKVFLGEYAAKGNEWYHALVEASYMIGLERNAKSVGLACYAPLLCNADYVNWEPDLIWFNQHQAYGTPNYYVQKLFMNYQGTVRLETHMEGMELPAAEPERFDGAVKLKAEKSRIVFEKVQMINDDTHQVMHYDDCILEDSEEFVLARQSELENFTIQCRAAMVSGNNGLHMIFGQKSEEDFYSLDIGGWQNMDCIISRHIHGKESVLSQRFFSLRLNQSYDIRLQMMKNKITVYIDGREMLYTVERQAKAEPLYYEASADEKQGTGILKLVNLREDKVKTDIVLEGMPDRPQTLKVLSMTAARDARNNLNNPCYVSPAETELAVEGNAFSYTVPPLSVVFMIWQNCCDIEAEQ